MSRTLPLALLLAASLACGPLVMIPGGALSGTPTAAPSDWAFTDAVDTVQLETNPDDPYSVNVWGVAAGDAFYIGAGDRTSQWAANILANPLVRLRVDDALYDLRATEVTDDAERDVFLAAVAKKYDYTPDPEDRDAATLFKLSAR